MKLFETITDKLTGRTAIGVGLLLTTFFLFRTFSGWHVSEPQARATAIHATHKRTQAHALRNIEQIRVGQRVLTRVPDGIRHFDGQAYDRSQAEDATNVDPATWRLIRMSAVDTWPDGTLDEIFVETLQPIDWIERNEIAVGSTIPFPLDLFEMDISPDLMATVSAIERCPPIEAGPGRVVLTTVNHLNPNVVELSLRDSEGNLTVVRPTALHKFYSSTRHDWLSAVDLQCGEHLVGLHGPVTLESLNRFAGVHRVYNLTVERDHVYRVEIAGILCHNNNCAPRPPKHHIFPQQFEDEFAHMGIPIYDYTMPLPPAKHAQIHGPWNEEWYDFFASAPQVTAQQAMDYAIEMIDRYDLWQYLPLVPYR